MAFVIKEHRPGRLALLTTILVLVWALSVWSAYQYGLIEATGLFASEVEKSRLLSTRLTNATAKNRELRAQIAVLERTAQVDREAKTELVQEIRDLQEQAAELREEIAFYKSIISPADGKNGLDVYNLEIMSAAQNLYHFKMILTQVGKSDSPAEGVVNMTIEGVLNGQAKSLGLSDVQVSKDPKLAYEFQYFQELSGSLELSEEFVPREVIVELTSNEGDKIENLVKRFDWLDVRI